VSTLEITGTFKLRKQDLAVEGYDPTRVRDRLYVADRQSQAYTDLDELTYQHLAAQKLRL
jgi:hypothetical protein